MTGVTHSHAAYLAPVTRNTIISYVSSPDLKGNKALREEYKGYGGEKNEC